MIRRKPSSARTAFADLRANLAAIRERLDKRLVANAAAFAQDSGNWGRIGDEARIVEHLALALAAAGDRSAVDELGIAY